MEAIQQEPFWSDPFKNRLESAIAGRSRLYALIAELFRYPNADMRRQMRSGAIIGALRALLENLPYPLAISSEAEKAIHAISSVTDTDIEVEFIRLFEAGPGSPPLPLLEGMFREDRKAIFKELILFYNHFGLSYAEGDMSDRPDHICYQMEFMHYLVYKELQSYQKEFDAAPYILAQKDFLDRHLLVWTNAASKKWDAISRQPPDPAEACLDVFHFYAALFRITCKFLNEDRQYLETIPVN